MGDMDSTVEDRGFYKSAGVARESPELGARAGSEFQGSGADDIVFIIISFYIVFCENI